MKAYSALLFVAALGGCAAGPSPEFRNFQPKIANPSAIIAAEIGFNQLAQEKGAVDGISPDRDQRRNDVCAAACIGAGTFEGQGRSRPVGEMAAV